MTVGTYDIWKCDSCSYELRLPGGPVALFTAIRSLPEGWTYLQGSPRQRSGHLCGDCSIKARAAVGIPAGNEVP